MKYYFKKTKYDVFTENEEKSKNLIRDINRYKIELQQIQNQIDELDNQISKYNFFSRLISNNYKKLVLKKENYIKEKEKLEKEISETDKEYNNIINEIKNFNKKIITPNQLMNKYIEIRNELLSNAKFDDGILYIDGDDSLNSKTINIKFDYDFNLDDLVLVHATDYMPQNGIITSSENKKITSDGITFYQHRKTIHFAINGRVGNHTKNNWDDKGIIIIDPIKEHINEITNFLTVDTYFSGSFKLTNDAVILIREDIFDSLPQEYLTKYKIVKFSGDSITAVNKVLIMMGYKPQDVGQDSWPNKDNEEIINNYLETNYPNIKTKHLHIGTSEWNVEKDLQVRDKLYAKTIGIKEVYSTDGIKNVPLNVLREMYKVYINKKNLNPDIVIFLYYPNFVEFCINNLIIENENGFNFLGDMEALKFKEKFEKNPKQYDEIFMQMFENFMGLKEVSEEEIKQAYEEYIYKIAGNQISEEVKKENFQFYLMRLINTEHKMIYIDNKLYLLNDNNIIKKLNLGKIDISKEQTYELYDKIYNNEKKGINRK